MEKSIVDDRLTIPPVEKVSFTTTDGVKIVGNYYEMNGSKAVLLLHQNGMDKSSWGDLSLALQSKGFAVLAIDLRGFGESTTGTDIMTNQPKTYNYQQFADQDYYPAMTLDVTAARKFLYSKGKTEQNIAGASIGANLAMAELASHNQPSDLRANAVSPFDPTQIDPLGRVKRIVALSPGLNFKGIQTELPAANIKTEYSQEKDRTNLNPIFRFGPLPIAMLVSAQGDDYSYQSAKKLQEIMGESISSSLMIEGTAHGTDLLTDKSKISEELINFLIN